MYILTKQPQKCFGRALQGLVDHINFNCIIIFYVCVSENAKETLKVVQDDFCFDLQSTPWNAKLLCLQYGALLGNLYF